MIAVVGIAILAVTAANSDNFRLQRIISWLNPEATADSGSYQVMQGLYAIGSGGFFGKGLGNSTQKLGVIPEAQNDMILVVICEELGVFGAFVIFLLFGILLYRLMFIAQNAPDLYGSLIATGIFAHIALQVTLNIAVVTGMLPTTGITFRLSVTVVRRSSSCLRRWDRTGDIPADTSGRRVEFRGSS